MGSEADQSYPDSAPLHPGYGISFVIAGLDPAIHATKRQKQSFGLAEVHRTSAWTAGSSPAVTRRVTASAPAFARYRGAGRNALFEM
jgi:hypothetical protein